MQRALPKSTQGCITISMNTLATPTNPNLEAWHNYMREGSAEALNAQLADDVTFYSPVVHTPQRGREITAAYLLAAEKVLGSEHFRYVREIDGGDTAVLEFATMIDGIEINGIDMITWNEEGKITDFKVMVRPLKAINTVHEAMGKMLMEMKKAG